ncbi:MAG: hypothetical protein QXZ47_03750 [Candidatus Bathyarchaeia archaeon]
MAWKEMLDSGWFVKIVLVLWFVSAGFIMYLLWRVDWIVHHELYNFGLQFSPEWALDYWAVFRMIYVFLAIPIFLSGAYFAFEVWRFVKGSRGPMVKAEAPKPKPLGARQKPAVAEQNHMLISCPKCKRVFSKPLVMLDFSTGRSRLVNVCPYCNFTLSWGGAEKEDVGLLDLEKRKEVRG